MITKEMYRQYIADFNAACAGDGTGFGAFYDKWYEPDAVFEYIPMAKKNQGKAITVSFWENVHSLMQEKILDHTTLLVDEKHVATEAPIDFPLQEGPRMGRRETQGRHEISLDDGCVLRR